MQQPDSEAKRPGVEASHVRAAALLPARIDELCDRFDAQWREGGAPRIESYLEEAARLAAAEVRGPLLRELLLVEHEYLSRAGAAPSLKAWLARFPADEALLREALSGDAPASTSPLGETTRPISRADETLGEDSVDRENPRILDDFELLEEIGRGGMGVIYKARQRSLDRVVAVKVLRSAGFASREEVLRFRREALAAARVEHRNVVRVIGAGRSADAPFLAMEFVAGPSLEERIRGAPLAPRLAACYVAGAADGVQAAHDQGVLHRDVKPANILIDDDQPRVTDFGLARQAAEEGMTADDAVLGTPNYMAPEQAAGDLKPIGPAADVYALGATLYAATTGRPPFQSDRVADVLQQAATREPLSPRKLNRNIPRDLETICLKCLQKHPSARYASAAELSADLRRFLERRPIVARRPSPLGRAARWAARNPRVAALAALLLISVLVGAVTARRVRAETAARGYVRQLIGAEPSALDGLLDEYASHRSRAKALLHARTADPRLDAQGRFRVRLALAAETDDGTDDLMRWLLTRGAPEEVALAAGRSAASDRALFHASTAVMQDDERPVDEQLRAVSIAATTAPASFDWTAALGRERADRILRRVVELAATSPAEADRWATRLFTLKSRFQPSAAALTRDRGGAAAQSVFAATMGAKFGAGDTSYLVRLLADAAPEQFPVVFAQLAREADAAQELAAAVDQVGDLTSGAEAPRLANLAIAALRLGDAPTFRLIASRRDGAAAMLAARAPACGVPLNRLAEQVQYALHHDQHDLLFTCLLALGDYESPQTTSSLQDSSNLLALVGEECFAQADAGVHSAAAWVLRRWGIEAPPVAPNVRGHEPGPDVQPTWLLGPLGMTFTVIPATTFNLGADRSAGAVEHHEPIRVDIPRTFIVSQHEFTQGQFVELFGVELEGNDYALGGPDHAMGRVSWLKAAEICNRLTLLEGLGRESCCYRPLTSDPSLYEPVEDHLNLPGYRMPTEAEWECAARAGAATTYYFGDRTELLPRYAWCYLNSGGDRHAVGAKPPNRWGLFDVSGNAVEWCDDYFSASPSPHIDMGRPSPDPAAPTLRVLRGGAAGDVKAARYGLSARDAGSSEAAEASINVGLRVARTLSKP